MKKIFTISLFFLFSTNLYAQVPDTPFIQPVSVKYKIAKDLKGSKLKKVVIDYNDRVFVLTNKGLGKVEGNKVGKNLLYRPLIGKIPVDITIQEGTGDLYYLFNDHFLSNMDAGKPYGSLPSGKFNRIAVAVDSSVLLAGDKTIALYTNVIHGKLRPVVSPAETAIAIKSYQNTFYVLYPDGVYKLKNDKLKLPSKGKGLKAFAFRGDEIFLGTKHGYYSIGIHTGNTVLPLQKKIPIRNINELMVTGELWAGTGKGAFMKNTTSGFSYYASKRWLNEDHVISMAADPQGNVYLLTPTGLNEIKFTKMTLRQKAKYFQHMTRQRHIRYGLLAPVSMKIPGDLATGEMIDTDNDGLWTSFYLGSQAFRYAATKNPQARRYCWESFAAFEKLLSITSVEGVPARSFERKGVKSLSDASEWHPSPDSGWVWKDNISSDEFVGHMFAAAVMDEFVVQTKAEKKRVADFVDKELTNIIKHKWNFVHPNGKPTEWGRWNPKYINGYPKTISDRKLGSTDIIAGLELGYALTGKAIFKKKAFNLMYKHGYLDNIMISPYNLHATPGIFYKGHNMGEGGWNHSDDEMEFLSYWVLYHYAFNNSLRHKFAKAIKAYWEIERPEKNPVWNLITLGTEGSFDRAATLWYLRQYPLDQIRWNIKNSIRKDLTFLKPNFRHQYTKNVLSPEEQPVHRWNANNFDLDGGDGGKEEYGGADYLLPYWMARYLNVIKK
jgi:hypothetical protein